MTDTNDSTPMSMPMPNLYAELWAVHGDAIDAAAKEEAAHAEATREAIAALAGRLWAADESAVEVGT